MIQLPRIAGVMERRILVSLRIRPDLVERLLPRPLRPRLIGGWNIGGVCLIRMRGARLAGFPEWMGLGSENAAYRFAVEWRERGEMRQGVYVTQRFTDSWLNRRLGGLLIPGRQKRGLFDVCENPDWLQIRVAGDAVGDRLLVRGRVADEWPRDSVFLSQAAADEFYRAGAVGWSDCPRHGRLDGIALECPAWRTWPLGVERFESGFFQDRARFSTGSVEVDSALLMRNTAHHWRLTGQLDANAGDENSAVLP